MGVCDRNGTAMTQTTIIVICSIAGAVAIVALVALGGRMNKFVLTLWGRRGVQVKAYDGPTPQNLGGPVKGVKAGQNASAAAAGRPISMDTVTATKGDVDARQTVGDPHPKA